MNNDIGVHIYIQFTSPSVTGQKFLEEKLKIAFFIFAAGFCGIFCLGVGLGSGNWEIFR